MSSGIYFEGRKYISAAEASSMSGLNRDYIGRLCRDGKVLSRRVGKGWFVEDISLQKFLVQQEYEKAIRREALSQARAREYGGSRTSKVGISAIPSVVLDTGEHSHTSVFFKTALPTAAAKKDGRISDFARAGSLTGAVARQGALTQSATSLTSSPGISDALRASVQNAVALPSDMASSIIHVPTHVITPVVDFAHRLVALTLALMLTFGTYALVDQEYAHYAMNSVKQAGRSIVSGVASVSVVAERASSRSSDALSLASTNPRAFAAAASTAVSGSISRALSQLAQVVNLSVDSAVYAVVYPQELISDTFASPKSGGVVAVDVKPYAAPRTYPQTSQTGEIAIASTSVPVRSQSVVQTIINQPVIERIVSNPVAVEGGISESYLDQRLQELDNKLSSRMYSLTSANSTTIAQNYNVTAQTNAINQLSHVAISNSTITGGTISGASISGGSLSVSDATISGAVIADSVTTTATSTLAGIQLSGIDCSLFGNSGKLTTDASGNVVCSDDYGSAGGAGSPGGSSGLIQFNDAGSFGGDIGFSYSKTSDRLTVVNASTTALSAYSAAFGGAATSSFDSNGALTLSQALAISSGGTGTTTAPSYGQLLLGNGSGGYNLVATSSLGILSGGSWGSITGTLSDQTDLQAALDAKLSLGAWYATTTDALAEGSINKYFSAAGVNDVINASTTIAKTTLANTWNPLQTFTNGFISNASSTIAGNLTTTGTITTALGTPAGAFLAVDPSGQIIATTTPAGGAGSIAWGSITGTLSDQSDLQAALNAKFSLSSWYATTTDALAQGSINKYFSIGGVNDVINASTTIVKSPAAPTYGQVLIGNSNGGFNLVATSTLGLSGGGGSSVWGSFTGTLSDQTDLQAALDAKLSLTNWYATTTDALAQGSINKYFSIGGVNDVINASTTIVKSPAAPTYGQVLIGNSNGGFNLVATSTLGLSGGGGSSVWGSFTGTLSDQTDLQAALDAKLSLTNWYATTTDALAQGSTNKYYSDTLVNTLINASTTIAKTTLANIWNPLQTFTNGFISNASSTVGDGTQTGGLTIFGGATTTGNAYFGANVGIGTFSPQTALDVVGNAYIRNNAGAVGSNDAVEIATDASAPRVSLIQGGRPVGLFSADAPGNLYLKNTAGGATILYGGSGGNVENARLTNDGYFGIGTTSPWKMLSVAGDIIGTNITATGTLDVAGYINAGQNYGFKQGGTTVLYASTTNNTLAVGSSAAAWMAASSTAWNSIAIGAGALGSTPLSADSIYNIGIGANSLSHLTTGSSNVALGSNALFSNTAGSENFALGTNALYSNTIGSYNVGIGASTLVANTSGSNNIGIGRLALQYNTVGQNNLSLGYASLNVATSSDNNTAIGYFAGAAISGATGAVGGNNTLIGYLAGSNITTGGFNTILGSYTGSSITTGSNNILIGQDVRSGLATTGSDQLNIGNLIFGTGLGSGTNMATGNVGIGTTSPWKMLSVAGDIIGTNITATGTLDVAGGTTLANATSTNLFSTTASSTNLFAQAAQFGSLSVLGTLAQTGLGTFTNGFVSQASSTVVGNFTTTGIIAANSFTGAGTGLTGTAASLSIGGNASTATKLAATKNINGVAFDGSSDITITAASSTLLANDNTFSGSNTFSSLITGSISGNAGTVTNGVYTTTFNGLFDTRFGTKSTTDLTEGSNLYFTTNRVAGVLAGTTTDALAQGSTNKYYSTNLFAADLAATTTTALAEGTNKYWTDIRFDNRLSATTTLPNLTTLANLTTVGTITSGTWSGLFGAVSGANLTNLTPANISAGTASINVTGNAGTATALQTSRTINGTTFDGTGNIVITAASSTLLANNNTWTGLNTFANATTTLISGNTAWFTTFVGALTGNASTATKLAATKNINGVAFDGSSDITITAASSTLLANDNTFSGINSFTGNTTLTNATSTSLFSTTASSTNLFAQSASFGSISFTNTLGVSNGGTGVSTLTGVAIGNGTSAFTAGTTQTCTNQFVRSMSASYVATCASVSLTADVTGTLGIANGGTGITSFSTGGVIFNAGSNLSSIIATATGNVLISQGVNTAPAWGKVDLTTHVTGTLPVANGGTGITSMGSNVPAWLGTPSSANLAAALTDETGTGSAVFSASPTLTGTLTAAAASFSGSVGVGTTTPFRKFAVQNTASLAQASIAYDNTRVAELYTDSAGDFHLNPSGQDAQLDDSNLWVCSGGSCPSGTPSGTGNLIVETRLGVATSTPQVSLAVAQNGAIQVGNAYLSSGGNFMHLANNEYYNGTSWVGNGTAGSMLQFNGNVANFYTHDGAGSNSLAMTLTGGKLGVGTSTPTDQLSVQGLLRVGANSNAVVTMGTATSTFNGDVKILGKLDVSTIDPVYMVDGVKYATYGASTVGIHEETLQTITLSKKDANGKYAYTIDFNNLEKGSDLWLFYQITDFGTDWKSLIVILTPGFDGKAYYTKVPQSNKLIVYADAPGEVSMRLSGNRYDFSKWPNLRPDQDGDAAGAHVVSSKE